MGKPPSDRTRFRFPGLGGYVDRMLRRLAAAPTGAELAELHSSLERTARQAEISLATKRLDAASLTPAAQSLRGWIAFCSDLNALTCYVAAVSKCTAAVNAVIALQRRWKPPVQVFFRPLRGLYQARQTRVGFELSLPTAAICLGDADWATVARYVVSNDKPAKRDFIQRTLADDYRALSAELDALGGGAGDTAGRVYDLDDVFDRVDVGYFDGAMQRPRLVWSRSPTFRKFGHYDWIGDTVMLSRTLDAADVPAFAVDFVMYHELLHKAHGLRWTADGSRGYAHTAAFYRDEKRFLEHTAAEAVIKQLAAVGRKRP